ncbi:hypothetical protein [Asaccharospora irregularis]|uniref:DUF4083 domain-containing protein n=1 Tax=Asaccharospora irregularis DSM 2635 TaxID=1121321 RepID=A0A1M5LQA3_9FIRM|nr:hypothetical protein [Asaccharospora irregularis]SHG67205.1 hypothetical protein SAMN04488530_10545 [Asaccharospora irregularis DSM 2635]
MSITIELFFQIFNTFILVLIAIILIWVIPRLLNKVKSKNTLMVDKINNLEKKINELEDKQ